MFVPKEKTAGMGTATRWVEDFSPGALQAIGALELLATAGLVLSALPDIGGSVVVGAAFILRSATSNRRNRKMRKAKAW